MIAVGGYGRGELSPHSDIDLLFALGKKVEVTPATLRGLLYPLWDAGFRVGHATRSPREAIDRAVTDLDAATSILSARLIAGDETPFEELLDRRLRWVKKEARSLARRIVDARADRHRRVERAGWSLAPELKEDVGGLRDMHVLGWLTVVAGSTLDSLELLNAHGSLMAVREALHAEVTRPADRLRIDLQPSVARRLGMDHEDGRDELMTHVHRSARVVEHEGARFSAELLERVVGGPRRSGSTTRVAEGVRLEDGALVLEPTADHGLLQAMRLLAARAKGSRPVARRSLEPLRAAFHDQSPQSWDPRIRQTFIELLSGPEVAAALELMDHLDAWGALLPEWSIVRGRAQHDPYHRYTVDAHSFLCVAEIPEAIRTDPVASRAAQDAGDITNLLVAALLHDVGKGSGEDHSIAGERLARSAAQRMGFTASDVEEIAALVRWHLLLVDTATRRDLEDGAVIETVKERLGDARLLRLLYVLSIADARATGPDGWNAWKAALVRDLYRKVLVALETGEVPTRSDVVTRAREIESYDPSLAGRAEELLATLPRSYIASATVPEMADELRLLARPPSLGEVRLHVYEGDMEGRAAITVCVQDRPGTLARTAGVLALNRISVLSAQAYSTANDLALERFVVAPPEPRPWDKLEKDLGAVYSGRLALEARLEKKAADYRPDDWDGLDVRVLQEESQHSTVVEVRSQDALGLLYAITAALSDLDLDIHVAKIDTLGARVVDVFYVRTLWGTKLGDEQCTEVERAIQHRIARFFGPS